MEIYVKGYIFFFIIDYLNKRERRNLQSGKSDIYDDMEVCFTPSIRGNNLLTINGRKYALNRRLKNSSYWECVKSRCKYTKCMARVITKFNKITALRGQHNHN